MTETMQNGDAGLRPHEALAYLRSECPCRNLVFDLDDTLYHRYDPYIAACERMFGERTKEASWPGSMRIYEVSLKIGDEEYFREAAGEITLEEELIIRAQRTFAVFGIELDAEEAMRFEQLYLDSQSDINLLPEFRTFLEEVKEKEPDRFVGIMTNGKHDRQWNKIVNLGLLSLIPEERIYISGDAGVSKPETEAFRIFEKKMQIRPEDTIMIGDSYRNDICGALAAGWHALHINPM
ncbi:MAG: HAD family hydrolase [Lachnospiraceae bacterium]|nr:HAD family hydrolase [Lachnospiraceae bacterium]